MRGACGSLIYAVDERILHIETNPELEDAKTLRCPQNNKDGNDFHIVRVASELRSKRMRNEQVVTPKRKD